MRDTTLIVPGCHGSGPGHWQSWMESRVAGARRLVVASSNDPWMPVRSLRGWTATWGSQLIGIGPAGHINTESGFGPWPDGLALLAAFQTAAAARAQGRRSA